MIWPCALTGIALLVAVPALGQESATTVLFEEPAATARFERHLLTDVQGFFRGLMIDAIAAIYGNASHNKLLTATQLNATSWDDFETATGGVNSVQTRATTENTADEATTRAEQACEKWAADATRGFSQVEVFFGTDRKNEGTPDAPRFSGERGGTVSLGRIAVTVPKDHKFGKVERPWSVWRTTFGQDEDSAKYFTNQGPQIQDQVDFALRLRAMVGAPKRFDKQAFVFVHGFDVDFDEAAYRTAQIAYDLCFDGAPIFYSWPSRGSKTAYEYDKNSARRARAHLRSFLEMVRYESGADMVHLIAHSLGTDPLMEALAGLRAAQPEPQQPMFNQVILAAPDIDRDLFLDLAAQARGIAEGSTLYASSNDFALQVSRLHAHGVPRAGDVPAGGPVIDINIDTIDTSEIGTNFLSFNHSGYSANPILLHDIGQIMKTGLRPPDLRLLALQERMAATGRYWVYPRL